MRKRAPRAPRIHVNVDVEQILTSKERDSSHCMIAEAVRVAYTEAQRVSVDLQTIRFTDPKRGLRYTYLTPRIAQVPLIQFDQGIIPEPFSFILRNGQVTRAGTRRVKTQENLDVKRSAKQKQVTEAAQQRAEEIRVHLSKAKLARPIDGSHTSVPDKIGGRTPPTTPFARRRAFGLRALKG